MKNVRNPAPVYIIYKYLTWLPSEKIADIPLSLPPTFEA